MDEKPRRRRYRFSLRTLLIGVVVLSLPLGYVVHEAMIARERKTWMALHPRSSGIGLILPLAMGAIAGNPKQSPPLARRLMGDDGHVELFVARDEIPLAHRLFPEATIFYLR
jgi:hypothetical protein